MSTRTDWLHGWSLRKGQIEVVLGTSYHCVGCGQFAGIGCVAVTDEDIEWMRKATDPDWPFAEDNCPICLQRDKIVDLHSKIQRYESVLYSHGIPLSTLPSQPLSKRQREAIRRHLP